MLSEVVRVTRIVHDMSIKELSEKSGVSTAYISSIENNRRDNLTLKKLKQLVSCFDLSLEELFELNKYHDSIIGTKEELKVYQLLLLKTVRTCVDNDKNKVRSK